MTDNFGLILRLILDKGGQGEVKKGLDDTAKAIDNVAKSSGELTKEEKELKNSLSDIEKKLREVSDRAKNYKNTLEKLKTSNSSSVPTYEQLVAKIEEEASALHASAEEHRARLEQIKKERKEHSDLARFIGITTKELDNLSKEEYAAAKGAYEAQRQLDKYNKELQLTERRIADLRQTAESINRVSQGLFLAGSSIIGAVYLAANNEAQRIKEAGGVVDETTQKWLTAQERIKLSYQRIGRTALTEFLPLLEKAAALAEKGSKFVAAHPELVRAAINTAGVVATIGAVGMLVAKGIRIYTDIALIAAMNKYESSTFLLKATIDSFRQAVDRNALGGTAAGTGGGALGTVGTISAAVLTIAAGVIASAAAVALVNQLLDATGVNDKIGAARAEIRSQNSRLYPGLINDPEQRRIQVELNKAIERGDTAEIERLKKAMDDAIASTKGLTDGLDDLSASTEQAKDELAGMDIIRNLERENLEAERQYINERANILRQANSAVQDAAMSLAQATQRIRANLAGTLSSLSANFQKSNREADMQYQQERANIARQGNEEILQIQRNAQEELRRLDEDYATQRDELTRSRDALGLVKAQREYEKNKAEVERSASQEIAERRKQTAQQLADLKRSYETERAQRLAKYKQDIADAKAQATAEQAEAAAAFAQRMMEINRQRAQELSELQRSYNEERRQRIMAAYAQIQDLGNAMNAERIMRSRYYQIILQESTQFMAAYAASLRQGRTITGQVQAGMTPSRHSGGYTGDGLHNMKRGEFVLSPSTTAAAESLIGSQLSQQALLLAISQGGRGSFTLNDGRRFDSSIPLAERRAIENETLVNTMQYITRYLETRR